MGLVAVDDPRQRRHRVQAADLVVQRAHGEQPRGPIGRLLLDADDAHADSSLPRPAHRVGCTRTDVDQSHFIEASGRQRPAPCFPAEPEDLRRREPPQHAGAGQRPGLQHGLDRVVERRRRAGEPHFLRRRRSRRPRRPAGQIEPVHAHERRRGAVPAAARVVGQGAQGQDVGGGRQCGHRGGVEAAARSGLTGDAVRDGRRVLSGHHAFAPQ